MYIYVDNTGLSICAVCKINFTTFAQKVLTKSKEGEKDLHFWWDFSLRMSSLLNTIWIEYYQVLLPDRISIWCGAFA